MASLPLVPMSGLVGAAGKAHVVVAVVVAGFYVTVNKAALLVTVPQVFETVTL